MRARNLKPGYFKNEELGQCSFAERILFAGLWCLSDREGFFENRPLKIAAEIFPYDREITPKKISQMLCNLMSRQVITLIESHGYIPKFTLHNNPHPHEAKSSVSQEVKNILINICNDMPLTSREMVDTSRAESCILNPVSCIPIKNTLSETKIVPDPVCLEIYETLKSKISTYRPNQKFCNLETDIKKIDCMLRLDKRDSKQVLKLLCWYPIGKEFIPEIFSAQALREKYDKLETAYNRSQKNVQAAYDGEAVIQRMAEKEKYKKDLEEASKKMFGG